MVVEAPERPIARCACARRCDRSPKNGRGFRADAHGPVLFGHPRQVIGTALLGDMQALAQCLGQLRNRIRHDTGEHGCSLAAAGHQQPDRLARLRRRVIQAAQGLEFGAHRVADIDLLAPHALAQRFDLVKGGGDHAGERRQHLVGAAQHGVLLVDHGRNSAQLRRHDGRPGRDSRRSRSPPRGSGDGCGVLPGTGRAAARPLPKPWRRGSCRCGANRAGKARRCRRLSRNRCRGCRSAGRRDSPASAARAPRTRRETGVRRCRRWPE